MYLLLLLNSLNLSQSDQQCSRLQQWRKTLSVCHSATSVDGVSTSFAKTQTATTTRSTTSPWRWPEPPRVSAGVSSTHLITEWRCLFTLSPDSCGGVFLLLHSRSSEITAWCSRCLLIPVGTFRHLHPWISVYSHSPDFPQEAFICHCPLSASSHESPNFRHISASILIITTFLLQP